MNTDKLLQIHQTYSLMKIGEINKQVLIAQYAQCSQINELQRQIAASTAISRQILENQLKEIQHRESQTYYKSLVYKMREALEKIDQENDPIYKSFLMDVFAKILSQNIKEAKINLDEISDKNFCKETEDYIQKIKTSLLPVMEEYHNSYFAKLLSQQNNYHQTYVKINKQLRDYFWQKINIQREITEPNKEQNNISDNKLGILTVITILLAIFMPLSLIITIPILLFYSKNINTQTDNKLKNSQIEQKEELLLSINNKENELYQELEEHPYIKIKQWLTENHPYWDYSIETIESYIPTIKYNKLDKELYNAAILVVERQSIDIDQRSLKSPRILLLKQLENIGIIKGAKVLIPDVNSLNDYWQLIEEN